MEIISGVERRRRWRPEEKLRILAELEDPGATVAGVARRHELSRGLLWQWRAAQQRGELVVLEPSFVPVQLLSARPASEACSPQPTEAAPAGTDPRIEITLSDGTVLRVAETVRAVVLRRVLSLLRG